MKAPIAQAAAEAASATGCAFLFFGCLEIVKFILQFRGPRKKEKHSPVQKQLPQLPAQSALSSDFMVKKRILKNSDLA